ncbi:hypothetical protein MPSEU_000516100 [Mayamaea pseudoterrestris]|nr:hypothetical protein MPSEU_000516100 [Mayamaea pseudoterrestris]
MSDYADTRPKSQWFLTEVKDGVQIAQHRLVEPATVVGRSEDATIVLAHESCSRMHAVIYLDSLTIEDFSTHGTFVDRTKITQKSLLTAGTVIQFGASTRLYFLEEQHLSSGSDQIQMEFQSTNDIITSVREDVNTASGNGTEHGTLDQLPLSLEGLFRDESKVPTKLRKDWERFKANKIKVEHIQQESERICVKGELTQGQERQLERNRARKEQLQQVIQAAEDSLLKNLNPESPATGKERESCLLEEEEVDDRTNKTDRWRCPETETETEASLSVTFKAIVQQIGTIEQAVATTKQMHLQKQDRLQRLKDADDVEEAFFAKTDLDLSTDNLEKLYTQQRTLEKSLHATIKLLKLVNPKLTVDPVTGYVGSGRQVPAVPVKLSCVRVQCPSSQKPNDLIVSPPPRTLSDTNSMLPPPKRPRAIHHSSTAFGASQASVSSSLPLPISKPSAPLARKGTLAILNLGMSEAAQAPSANSNMASVVRDFRTDTWRAPTDQDGSGITKLNQKFAERY